MASPSSTSYQRDQHGGEIGVEDRKSNMKSTKSHVTQSQSVAQSQSCPKFTCERCKAMVRPIADTLPDFKTHLVACLLFIIGLPFFCFLPYCFNCCGKSVKRCPQCGAFINTDTNANTNTNPSSR